ncbi:MAG: response regulator [Pirellulales bacterium]|nr:response regulator [Pirellulales bacterium]
MLFEPPSILITDDDHGFRETVRGMLEPRGFRTYSAADGEEAVRIAGVEPVHLLLVDMHMPRLTGLETARRLRQINSRLPFVLLSAALDELIVEQARSIEAFSVLPKPVSRQTLTTTVDQVFQRIYGWPERAAS